MFVLNYKGLVCFMKELLKNIKLINDNSFIYTLETLKWEKITDYDEIIKLANKLTGEYDKSVIFHCYWHGNLKIFCNFSGISIFIVLLFFLN